MTTMATELYDALRDAGASEEKARMAAVAAAGHEQRFDRLERQIGAVEARIDRIAMELSHKIDQAAAGLERKIDALRAEQNLLRWMGGTSVALSLAILVKLFIH